jgi:hypothetical protein
MKKFKVKQWYEALECECGGVFSEPKNNTMYTSYPAQKDYLCNKCGTEKRLYESQWPHMETQVIGI